MTLIEPIPIIAADFPKVVVPLVDSALYSIDILVFDWRFYPTQPANAVSLFNSAIVRATRRGVMVNALVNSEAILPTLRDMGCSAKVVHSKKLLHTKMMVVDGVNIVIGSHNYTQNAFCLNEEASVLIKMGATDNDFVKYFAALWAV